MSWWNATALAYAKERLARKIGRRIEALGALDPGLRQRLSAQARVFALRSLGLTEIQAEFESLASQQQELQRRQRQAQRAMLAVVRRVPIEAIAASVGSSPHPEVTQALSQQQAAQEEELLAQHEGGREILRPRRVKDNLLDTLWLALAPAPLQALWQRVLSLLGEEPTPLQKEVLCSDADQQV